MEFNPMVLIGIAAGLVVLVIAVNAMLRKNAGVSSAKVDALENKVADAGNAASEQASLLAAKVEEAIRNAQSK